MLVKCPTFIFNTIWEFFYWFLWQFKWPESTYPFSMSFYPCIRVLSSMVFMLIVWGLVRKRKRMHYEIQWSCIFLFFFAYGFPYASHFQFADTAFFCFGLIDLQLLYVSWPWEIVLLEMELSGFCWGCRLWIRYHSIYFLRPFVKSKV